jgi:2,3-bisphosphoglycerate-independent phosphoglycerate mutase
MTTKTNKPPKTVLLCILDGWGHREEATNNAIKMAHTPNYDKFWNTWPHSMLKTSGEAVGLPAGQMGNSEVGHMNLGGGRIVKQDLPRIDEAIHKGLIKTMPEFQAFADKLKKTGGTCHLMGLLSPGGVHSHQDQIAEFSRNLSEVGIPVIIHAFLDGRDTPPRSAQRFLNKFEADISGLEGIRLATISGRYYAMDRDNRWDRIELATKAINDGVGPNFKSAKEVIEASYENNVFDEFVLPSVIGNYRGMKNGDGIFMANFRADRAREILTALSDPDFSEFKLENNIELYAKLGLVEYSNKHSNYIKTLFSPIAVRNNLGEVVSHAGLNQLRIAETEKYAHVTFFFNGGSEHVFENEDRILVPSPNVATYDLKPEMSAPEVTTRMIGAINSGKYNLIIANFANPDMVGHTGNIPAAIKAVEVVDSCIGLISKTIKKQGGVMLVTADHGNVEQMLDFDTHQPHTAHTTLDVPLLLLHSNYQSINDGALSDVAPTLLSLLNIKQPSEMTGVNLLN